LEERVLLPESSLAGVVELLDQRSSGDHRGDGRDARGGSHGWEAVKFRDHHDEELKEVKS
jgi:hypothetical protein